MTVTTTIALISALLVVACAIPEEAFDGSLEGDYYINGVDPQGVEYSGLLTIAQGEDPDTYELQWIITGSVQQGIGRVQGSRLTANWDAIEGYDTASYGTASYEIRVEGELVGERTVAGQEGTGTEEAFPIR
ncbi:MAG: hypothetical protein QNJ89_11610 [Acidimicrobiia bacterium]|nr:hypothetical protein [Acidimicrobiia bacterium]